MFTILRAITVAFSIGCAAFGFTTNSDDVPLVKLANAWKPSEQIPAELLVFRESRGCLFLATDTAPVISSITNYALLQEILVSPCDERIFGYAAARALSLVGPNQFFKDIHKEYSTHPSLLSKPRHRRLNARSKLPHVVVDGLFIGDSDMKREASDRVLSQITADLNAGMLFDNALTKYCKAYEYSYVETLSDGTKIKLTRTRVGNYGDFIISEHSRDARPFRLAEVPAEHLQPLLSRRAGSIVVLRDEAEHRSILYRVREVYTPTR